MMDLMSIPRYDAEKKEDSEEEPSEEVNLFDMFN